MNLPEKLTQEEEKYYIEKFKSGDMTARNKLIEHNLRLVAHIVKKMTDTGVEKDDLFEVGAIGLIKSIDTYNPERNIKLDTYAAKCIKNEIFMFLRKPRYEKTKRIDIFIDEKNKSVEAYLDKLSDNLPNLEEKIIEKEEKETIRKVLNLLSERERKVLISSYYYNKKQNDIAEELGIQQPSVSRILRNSYKKIKPYFL